MIPLLSHCRSFDLLAPLLLLAALASDSFARADPPLVAIPPAILLKVDGSDSKEKSAAPLAERVQFTLEADPSFAFNRFVERTSLDALLKEQTLALTKTTTPSPTASIRTGRLLHADWILHLRLRADDLTRPRVEAEVIDALRADLLARVETPLDELPNESWLLQPTEAAVRLTTALAVRALRTAEARQTELAAATRVAPLAFLDHSGNERLAPLAPLLQAALRSPRPGLHVLGYEAETSARAESALFLAGLTDLDPQTWARIADAYVWGDFTEADSYSGPVADLPVKVRLTVWSDDRGPRETSVEGRFGDLPALAESAASAALALVGHTRISDPFAQRPAVAARLRESARELRRQAGAATLPSIAAPIVRAGVRLDDLASFFDPLAPTPQNSPKNPASPSKAYPIRSSLPSSLFNSSLDPSSDQPLETLLAAADSGPIMLSPWLAPEWAPIDLAARRPLALSSAPQYEKRPFPLALAHDALWVTPRPAWGDLSEKNRPGIWRLDLTSPSTRAEEIAGVPGLPITNYAPSPDSRLWFSTRGEGLIGIDPSAASPPRRISVAEGLPRSDLMYIYRGPESWFIGPGREREGPVTSVSFDASRIAQVTAPPSATFPGLPAAARAAIAAFGDESPPLVRLPATPVFAYEEKPLPAPGFAPALHTATWARKRSLPVPFGPEESDPRQLRTMMHTGAGDGYWTANLHTVFWAAGSRRVPLACWLQGEISALADDGRHLIVAVARRVTLYELPAASANNAPDTIALHLYDYQAGVWRGRIATPNFFSLLAGDGRLLLVPFDRVCRLATTTSLRPTTPPTAPPPQALPATFTVREDADAKERIQNSLIVSLNGPSADLDALRAALAAGADPAPPDDGRTLPLLLAANRSHYDAFNILLPLVSASSLNAVPLPQPGSLPPPLRLRLFHTLLDARRPDLARRVIEAGAKPDYLPHGQGDSLAWLAIRCGDPKLVARFHAAGWPLGTHNEQHPLREAVAQKNAPLLHQLIELSSHEDINSSYGNGQTALFAAADAGWTEGVRLLLEAGADNFDLDALTKRRLRDVAAPWPEVSVLINRRPGASDNQLDGARAIAAILKGDPANLRAISPSPAVLRYRDFWSWTVLHIAARRGHADLVTRLLAAGAPPDDLTGYGESALCLAVFNGDTATVSALLRAGADVNRHANRGWLPLHAAAQTGRADLVRTLLAAHADPAPSVGENSDPVLVLAAATSNDEESLRLLIKADAPLDRVDKEGFGPLEAAVLSDSPTKIQYLLDQGARWQKPVGPDYHPMDAAAKRGLTRSIRKLQQLGLQSLRALSLAKDDATRALLQSDDSEAGRLRRLNEEQWRVVIAEPDAARRRERVRAHLTAGADPNHLSAQWGTPLELAVFCRDPELVKLLIARGADPAIKTIGLVAGRYLPLTALHSWFSSYFAYRSESTTLPPDFENHVLEYLPIFWSHDSKDAHEEMLDWTDRAKLLRAAAWMRAHP